MSCFSKSRVSLAVSIWYDVRPTVPDALIRYRAMIYDGFFVVFCFCRAPKNAVMIRGYPKHNATFSLRGVELYIARVV